MSAGQKRHRIILQHLEWSGKTAYGEKAPVWVDGETIWAAVMPLRGNEIFAQTGIPQVEARVDARIKIRSRKGLDPGSVRVKHGPTVYDVQAVLQDVKNYETQLMVRARELDQGDGEAVNP